MPSSWQEHFLEKLVATAQAAGVGVHSTVVAHEAPERLLAAAVGHGRISACSYCFGIEFVPAVSTKAGATP
jgi:hypothetical protein